uniref:Retrotransposon gag domain-containing protein n=1 Tax=Lygus hesperus TaxID=30085 RepID=A0A0A9XYT7_LYGHE
MKPATDSEKLDRLMDIMKSFEEKLDKNIERMDAKIENNKKLILNEVDDKINSNNKTLREDVSHECSNFKDVINKEMLHWKNTVYNETDEKLKSGIGKVNNAIGNLSNEWKDYTGFMGNKFMEWETKASQRQVDLENKLRDEQKELSKTFDDKPTELNVQIFDHVEVLKNQTSCMGTQNKGNVPNIRKEIRYPTFANRSGQHPMVYLKDLDEYFDMFPLITSKEKLRIVELSLKGKSFGWFRQCKYDFGTYDDFKVGFKDRYWGEMEQLELLGKLNTGSFKAGSREEYAREWFEYLKFVDNAPNDAIVIKALMSHFPDVKLHLVQARITDRKHLFEQLRMIDQVQRGNDQYPGPKEDNTYKDAYRSNYNDNFNDNKQFKSRNNSDSFGYSSYNKDHNGKYGNYNGNNNNGNNYNYGTNRKFNGRYGANQEYNRNHSRNNGNQRVNDSDNRKDGNVPINILEIDRDESNRDDEILLPNEIDRTRIVPLNSE